MYNHNHHKALKYFYNCLAFHDCVCILKQNVEFQSNPEIMILATNIYRPPSNIGGIVLYHDAEISPLFNVYMRLSFHISFTGCLLEQDFFTPLSTCLLFLNPQEHSLSLSTLVSTFTWLSKSLSLSCNPYSRNYKI